MMRLIFSTMVGLAFISTSLHAAEERLTPPTTPTDFTWAAKVGIPAVVLIKVKFAAKNGRLYGSLKEQEQGQDSFDFFNNENFWEHFFNIPKSQGGQGQAPDQQGQGSGFLISANGHLITNSHVVREAKSIVVVLQDGREFTGKLVGADANSDVAVVKIEGEKLPFLTFGNSDDAEVGQWVAAIGNPLGLKASLTVGVISGKRRSDLDIARDEDFIQTDAAINKGNSGGPLLNMKGEVIGLNTAIASTTGGSMGIGFAVPSNMVHYIVEQLMAGGSVDRGYAGLNLQPIDNDLAQALGLDKIEGALVTEVVKGSPADAAGLRQGDVILKYDQKPVDNLSAFSNKIALTKPGTQIRLTVKREKQIIDLSMTIGSHPDKGADTATQQSKPKLGIEVEELTPALAQSLAYQQEAGVVVSKVYQGTPAALIGLKKGALIMSVNNVKVSNVSDYNKALKEVQAGQVTLLLVKQGNVTRYITLRVE
jgi:serine protease Do